MRLATYALLALILSACGQPPADHYFGLAITIEGGQVTDVSVLGQTKSREECVKFAREALAARPAPAGVSIACADAYEVK
jgi:hypothetical protein